MEEKIKKYIKAIPSELRYEHYEQLIKSIIESNIDKDKIEYFIEEVGLDGKNVDFNSIKLSNEDVIREVIINKKKIEDKVNDITSIEDENEAETQKLELIFESLYDSYSTCSQYIKNENLIARQNLELDNKIELDKVDETYLQKLYALNKMRKTIINCIGNDETIKEKLDNFVEETLAIEDEKEIDRYKRELNDFYYKYRQETESPEELLSRLSNEFKDKISKIDRSRKGEEINAVSYDPKTSEIIQDLKDDIQANFVTIQTDMNVEKNSNYSKEMYDNLNKELERIDKADSKGVQYSDLPDEVSSIIKDIIKERERDLSEIEKTDPEQSIYNHLKKVYPGVLENIAEKMDPMQFYEKIDHLPKDVEDYLKNEFFDEYKGFIEDIKLRGEKKQKELEEKLNLFEEKYTEGIYNKYKVMSDKEKEDLLEYSDKEIAENLTTIIERQKELARLNVKNDVGYGRLFDYTERKRENLIRDNNEIIENIKEDIKDSKVLNEFFSKYFNSNDVAKSLNNMSNDEMKYLIQNSPNGIRSSIEKISKQNEDKYGKLIESCGNFVLDIANYDTDDRFSQYISAPNDSEIKKEIVSMGLYQIHKNEQVQSNIITSVYKRNARKHSAQELEQLKQYIDLKNKSSELNLKEKSALINIKVEEPDNIGLQKLIKNIDNYNEKLLNMNKNQKEVQGKQIEFAKNRESKLLDKIQWAEEKVKEMLRNNQAKEI